jgi:8-oxo-dGTP pyrophosphatase MutT (NUDIX family)
MSNKRIQVQDRITLYEGLYLKVVSKQLVIMGQKKISDWEIVERAKQQEGVVGIFKMVNTNGCEYDKLLLIRQWRPSVENYVIEFPAGMVDKGETPAQAIAREVEEETGYIIKKRLFMYGEALSSAGMSAEKVYTAVGTLNPLAKGTQKLGALEDITSFMVEENELMEFLHSQRAQGDDISSRVLNYAIGKLEML